MDMHSRRLPQGSERRKLTGSEATTRFPRASCFWETHLFCSRNMGAHVRCSSAKKLVSSDFAKILEAATKIRETCEKTLFTPSSPLKATILYRFCLSNRWSPKVIACLAIACCKNASEHWAIRHCQNYKRLFSEYWLPNRHCFFSDKRAQNYRIYLAIISSILPVIISDINMPNG